MSQRIKISDFKGIFSNSDRALIPAEFLTELKNYRSVNGKLIKTHGIGAKIGTAAAAEMDNLYTYIHDELSGDELYILVYVNTSSHNAVTVYGWDGSIWKTLNTFSDISIAGAFYHKSDRNPIVYADGIVRFLPGNAGENDQADENEPLWLGYIDRDYFDGNYSPTAQFYGMSGLVIAPALTFTPIVKPNGATGPFSPTEASGMGIRKTYYYKFTYMYDGIQESLFSNVVAVSFWNNTFLRLEFTIIKATHNKRVTSLNIYRADDEKGIYYKVNTIDFMRETGTTVESSSADGYYGVMTSYVPQLTSFNFNAARYYALTFEDAAEVETTVRIETPGGGGTGHEIFTHRTGYPNNLIHFDCKFTLKSAATEGGTYNQDDVTDTTGAYSGDGIFILSSEETTNYVYAEGILNINKGASETSHIIVNNYQKAIWYNEPITNNSTSGFTWRLLGRGDGLLDVEDDTNDVIFTTYDIVSSADEEQHPLYNESRYEKYIKVNGKFARVINGRLFQLNVILDPGGKNEIHDDWLMYSEFGQYDVTPASNQLDFPDVISGEGTGLADLFGNPVVLKKQSIIFINSKTYPADPTKWNIIESAHNIGNIAPQGYIEASGALFVCYIDGIYRFRPNNLAETDSTPTERLRVSEPIGDVYNALSLANKVAIKSGYNPETSEVIFILGSEIWCFNIVTETWREEESGITPAIISTDENGQAIVFQDSDKKLYSFGEDESVAESLTTKTFEISVERKEVIKYMAVTYKSPHALTMKVYYEDEVPGGDIQSGVVYSIKEDPYIDGATYEVTYNGTAYNHGDTFTGTVGSHDYTISGVGVVEHYTSHTLPANAAPTAYKMRIARWCRRLRIEITGASNTNNAELNSIELVHN